MKSSFELQGSMVPLLNLGPEGTEHTWCIGSIPHIVWPYDI